VIIAVTGGMGAGKSTVAGLLGHLLGYEVVDADTLCRNLLQPYMPGWQGIQKQWGARFFDLTGSIDRPALREALFADSDVRQRAEQILHPLVRQDIMRQVAEKRLVLTGLVVEVPLLFEAGWENDFDWVVVVYADHECCAQRIVRRDLASPEAARVAVDTQIPLKKKALRADSVIENSGPVVATILQIYHLFHLLSG
jgi:dephospho-CoA kinase